jgi:3,4-dihydroxy 2-butanone 4-phosphate synthase/GTP cyclohydrolase II
MANEHAGIWESDTAMPTVFGTAVPTLFGVFRAAGYQSQNAGTEHLALFMGSVSGATNVLTRLHSACMTGDVFSSRRCDCGVQLVEAMRRIAGEGVGVLVYNPTHEGRGIGLFEKLRAYGLQDEGFDTVEANLELGHAPDSRRYGIEAQILQDLKVKSVRLMTNNPDKVHQLEASGVGVTQRIPFWVGDHSQNEQYRLTKIAKLGHWS